MMRDLLRWLQLLMRVEHGADGAQDLDGQRGDIHDGKALGGGFGHPSWDLQINAVGSTDGDRDLGVARCPDDVQFRTSKWMEWVVNADSRRLGIVECCS